MALVNYHDGLKIERTSDFSKRIATIINNYGIPGHEKVLTVLTARTNRGLKRKIDRWLKRYDERQARIKALDTPLEPGAESPRIGGGTLVDIDFAGDYEEVNPDLKFRRDQLRKFRTEGGKEVPATVKVFRSNETNQFMIAVNFHPGDSHASLDVNLFVTEETVKDASTRDLAVSVPAIIERIF